MPVGDIAKETGISRAMLYVWANKKKIPVQESPEGIKLLSLDAVKAYRKEVPTRRGKGKTKAEKPVKKMRPATKQVDQLSRVAACMEVFFPEGVPVGRYIDALVLVKALDAVS
jgi:hypothetical protein